MTQIGNGKIAIYHNDILAEGYNEALLKKKELRMEKNKSVMKKLILS